MLFEIWIVGWCIHCFCVVGNEHDVEELGETITLIAMNMIWPILDIFAIAQVIKKKRKSS